MDEIDAFFQTLQAMESAPLTAAAIRGLSDEELDDRVWLRVSALVDVAPAQVLPTLDPPIRAYYGTRLFEWEVGNGGLHQYFYNHPEPEILDAAIEGYSFLGLEDQRRIVAQAVRPVAQREAEWRASLRDGRVETFLDAYTDTQLNQFDQQIVEHDDVRLALVRANAEMFAD